MPVEHSQRALPVLNGFSDQSVFKDLLENRQRVRAGLEFLKIDQGRLRRFTRDGESAKHFVALFNREREAVHRPQQSYQFIEGGSGSDSSVPGLALTLRGRGDVRRRSRICILFFQGSEFQLAEKFIGSGAIRRLVYQ